MSRTSSRLATAASAVAAGLLLAATASADPSHGGLEVSAMSGSDANACTHSAPCKTIGHALSVAAPGARVMVDAGTYPEAVTVTKRVALEGHDAVVDAAGDVNGIAISGAGAAGTRVSGFEVENALAQGMVATSTARVEITGNRLHDNDKGAGTPATPLCAAQGDVPGDCGEALHLMGVADSQVVGNVVEHNVGGILVTDETGPSHGNLIKANISRDNLEDCGITLPSHNPNAVADPSQAGVYDNTVVGNLSQGNGGAGVGMFAPAPGTASYNNRVVGNTLVGNGMAGVAIHAHTPGENVSGNVMVANRIAGNGVDPDADTQQPTGISLFSAGTPAKVVVAGNEISDEFYGVFIKGPLTVKGLRGNRFARSVTMPVGPAAR